MMSHVLRWNFDFAFEKYAVLARLLNLAGNSDSMEVQANKFLDHVDLLISEVHINKRLRNYMEHKTMLEKIVKPIMKSPCAKVNPRVVACEEDVYDVLEAAW